MEDDAGLLQKMALLLIGIRVIWSSNTGFGE